MTKQYTPRRASKRWLDGAPAFVLDCFDDKGAGDRYTVFFGTEFMSQRGSYAESWVAYLGMDGSPTHPQGISMWGEMEAYQAAQYRYARKHRRVKWSDLPENIRRHVVARATAAE